MGIKKESDGAEYPPPTKIALAGKGGVGKSTVAAALAALLAAHGHKVLALDTDPDANLANALGVPADLAATITPISKQIGLIEERTGVKIDEYGKVFKLNPEVSDVAERFAYRWHGVDILVLGAAQKGGGGCACPENAFIKALVTDLVLYKNETLIMDMEAGIEHLGRATAHGVDVMLVVVEPGKRSVDCAKAVARMAEEIGIRRTLYVGNKITSPADESFIRAALNQPLAAVIPYDEHIRAADRQGVSVLENADRHMTELFINLLSVIGVAL